MSDSSEATSYEGKLIIGLTGNIATGKSAVLQMAADRGALAIDADRLVHEMMDSDANLQAAIAVAFGSEIRRKDGRIDRKALGNVVFNDATALQDLEVIVHPAVRKLVDTQILASDTPVIFIEAIKLLEGALADTCHQIWVTRCSKQRQLERLRVCRGLETDVATARIKAQPPQAEKVALADAVIDTNGFMKDTEIQFNMAWSRLPDPATVEAKPRLPLPTEDEDPMRAKPRTGMLSPEKLSSPPESKPQTAPPSEAPLVKKEAKPRPDDMQVRRARPSDIPSILLLMQKATDGAVKMKRAELLMALSERGYFIGQIGSDVSTVIGWKIDSQVGRIEEIYIHPPEMISETGTAVLEDIEQSAQNHLCQVIVAFLPEDSPDELRQIFDAEGYEAIEWDDLAANWQLAINESKPDNTYYMVKILLDTRLSK